MRRTFAVVLIAALCAALFGVDRPSAAQGTTPAQATDRQAIEARLASIKVNSPVQVRLLDGTTVKGLLAEKRTDDISVDVYRRRAFRGIQFVRRDAIPLSEIKDIRKELSDRQRAALAAAISAGVLLGTCAIALANYHAESELAPPDTGATNVAP